jgi:hypothetical protein
MVPCRTLAGLVGYLSSGRRLGFESRLRYLFTVTAFGGNEMGREKESIEGVLWMVLIAITLCLAVSFLMDKAAQRLILRITSMTLWVYGIPFVFRQNPPQDGLTLAMDIFWPVTLALVVGFGLIAFGFMVIYMVLEAISLKRGPSHY